MVPCGRRTGVFTPMSLCGKLPSTRWNGCVGSCKSINWALKMERHSRGLSRRWIVNILLLEAFPCMIAFLTGREMFLDAVSGNAALELRCARQSPSCSVQAHLCRGLFPLSYHPLPLKGFPLPLLVSEMSSIRRVNWLPRFLVFRCHTLFPRERSRLCGLSQLGNIDNSLHTSCLHCMLFFLYFPFYFIVLRHALHVEKHVLNAGRVPLSTTVGS